MRLNRWLWGAGVVFCLTSACGSDDPVQAATPETECTPGAAGSTGRDCKDLAAQAMAPTGELDPKDMTAPTGPVMTPVDDTPVAPMPATEPSPRETETTPVTCLTGGSGGPHEDLTEQTFASDQGQESKYHLYAANIPADVDPVGLLVYLHGDGADEYNNPRWSIPDIRAHADAHDLLTMVLRSPDTSNGTTWWRQGDENARWVRALLEQEIFPKYNVDRARVLLVGYSGGAEFTTQNLVPQHADLLCGGGAVVFGGGGRPWGRGTMFAPEFVSAFKMHWYTGQDDTGCSDCSCDGFDALSASTGGADYYEARGFTVSLEQPEGIDHCNIPIDMVIGEQLDAGVLP